MPGLNFDIDGARAAGYSDAQIADTLAQKSNFDSAAARAAGFKDADIITRLTAPQQQVAAPAPAPEVEDPGIAQTMLIGAGRTFDRIGKGVQQIYHGVTGDKAAQDELATRAAEDDKVYTGLQELHPVATAIGESAPSMAIPLGGTAKLGTTIGKLALSGAAPNLLEYGSAEERLKRGGAGAAGSVVGGVVLPKVAGAIWEGGKAALKGLAGNITPQALALAARARDLGIGVNAAQLGDSKFLKTLASAIEQMPFTGGAKANAQHASDFTRAVSKTFGEDVEKVTPEVYAAAKQRLGKSFDDLAMRNTLNVTESLMTRLDGILSEATQMGDDGTVKAVKGAIDRLMKQSNASTNELTNVAQAGVPRHTTVFEVPGAAYSSIDSMLGKTIKAGGEKALYLKEVQKAIRAAMDESISAVDKEAWDLTRGQYKNLKAVRDVVAKGAGDGNIPPMQLLNALNNSEAGKEAMAMGTRGTLGELGRIGRQFVRDPIPNSGTAQRAIAMGLIGGGGYAFGADPTTIAGMLAGGATAGRAINKILMSPKVVESLAKKGLTVKELMKLPPDRITQIIGGAAGMAATN